MVRLGAKKAFPIGIGVCDKDVTTSIRRNSVRIDEIVPDLPQSGSVPRWANISSFANRTESLGPRLGTPLVSEAVLRVTPITAIGSFPRVTKRPHGRMRLCHFATSVPPATAPEPSRKKMFASRQRFHAFRYLPQLKAERAKSGEVVVTVELA